MFSYTRYPLGCTPSHLHELSTVPPTNDIPSTNYTFYQLYLLPTVPSTNCTFYQLYLLPTVPSTNCTLSTVHNMYGIQFHMGLSIPYLSSYQIFHPLCRRPIHTRFYFMDRQFRALEFPPSATAEKVGL